MSNTGSVKSVQTAIWVMGNTGFALLDAVLADGTFCGSVYILELGPVLSLQLMYSKLLSSVAVVVCLTKTT